MIHHLILLLIAIFFNFFSYHIYWPSFLSVLIFPYFILSFSLPIRTMIKLPIGPATSLGFFIWGWSHFWLANAFAPFCWSLLMITYLCFILFNFKKISIGEVKKLFSSLESKIFVTLYLLFLLIYSFFPSLFAGEKLMDMSILGFIQKTDSLPLQDPWFSGEVMNYYYFGYYLFGTLCKLLLIPIKTSYGVSLSLLPALLVINFMALANQFLSLKKSLLVALVFLFSTNLEALKQLFTFSAGTSTHFWQQSRMLAGGLFAEHPIWSFLWGDLHPHVMSMVFIPAFLLIIIHYLKDLTNRYYAFFLCIFFASFAAMNIWDFIFLFGLTAFLLMHQKTSIKDKVYTLSALLFFSVLLSLSFIMSYGRSGGELISTVKNMHNSLFHWGNHFGIWFCLIPIIFQTTYKKSLYAIISLIPVILFILLKALGISIHLGPYLFSSLLLVYLAGQEKNNRNLILIYSILILIIVESFTLMDRYNSIFKFYNSLYFLFGFSLLTLIFESNKKWKQWTVYGFSFLFILSFIFTIRGRYQSSYNKGFSNHTDHAKYLLQKRSGDYELIEWMRKNIIGLPTIIETFGESFDYETQRISSNATIISYIGWPQHLNLRGHDWSKINLRKKTAELTYTSPSAIMVHQRLVKAGVHFVVLGALERERHPVQGFEKFKNTDYFPLVYSKNGMNLYGVRSTNYSRFIRKELTHE